MAEPGKHASTGQLSVVDSLAVAERHAAEPMLVGVGFQFQVALLRLLKAGDDGQVFLEMLDDIDLREDAHQELIQAKHQLRRKANLTDMGEDIWGTWKSWVDQLAAGLVPAAGVSFIMVATGTAAPGTLAALLAHADRKPDELRQKFAEVAAKSKNDSIQTCHAAFLGLSEAQQEQLLSNARLLADAGDVGAVEQQILAELRRIHGNPDHRQTLFDMLVGWWLLACFQHVRAPRATRTPLTSQQLQDRIDLCRDQLQPENLPLDLPVIQQANGAVVHSALFIRQLKLLGMDSDTALKVRVREYMRAATARSEWYRRGLLKGGELDSFDDKLRTAWALRFTGECATLAADEPARLAAGHRVLGWAESQDTTTIRRDCTEAFVRRGSFHLLADDPALNLGWHPDFKERLSGGAIDGK